MKGRGLKKQNVQGKETGRSRGTNSLGQIKKQENDT